MKPIFKKTLALLLAFLLLPLSALAATKTDFTATLSLYPEGWNTQTRFLRDLAQAVKTMSVSGTLLTEDERVKPYGYPFNLSAALSMNGRSVVQANAQGTPQFFNLTSNLLGDVQLFLSMDNYYAFMAKPYYFMGIDTVSTALLTYPTGFIAAWEPEMDILYEMEAAARANGNSLSASETVAYAEKMGALVDTWDPLFRWISAVMMKNGGTYEFIWSMEELGDWVQALTTESGLTIADTDGMTSWVLGGQTVFTRTETDSGYTWQVFFPDKNDYRASMECAWQAGEKGGSLTFGLHVYEDESLLLDGTVAATGLPCAGCDKATAEITVTLKGTLYPEGTYLLSADWAREQQGESTQWQTALSLLNSQTHQKMLTLTADFTVEPTEESFDTSYTWDDYDILCMNDSMLSEVLSRIKRPLVEALVPFVLELPRGVLNEAYALAEKYGVMDMLREGVSLGGGSDGEDY